MPRWPQRSRKTCSVSPSRVPPDQSGTTSPAATSARSGSRRAQRAGDVGEPGADGEGLDGAAAGRADWVSRCASRSSASAYALIEPLTSTSSTTRRGRAPRRRQAISPGSPEPAQRVAQGAGRVDVAAVPASGAGPYADSAGAARAGRTSRPGAASRRRRARRRRGAGAPPPRTRPHGPRPRRPSPSPPPALLGVRQQVGGRGPRGAARGGACGRPSRAVEPRLEDLVEARQVVGRGAQGRAAGPVGRLPVVETDLGDRGEEALGPVLGHGAHRPRAAPG